MLRRDENKTRQSPPAARRAAAAAVVLAIAGLFAGGCGASLSYDLPAGKSLVYGVFSENGLILEQNKKEKVYPSKASKKNIEAVISVMDKNNGIYTLNMKTRIPGRSENPLYGKTIGFIQMHMDSHGRITDSKGMGIPVEIRLLMPALPARRMKKHYKWNETIRRDLLSEYRIVKNEYARSYIGVKLTHEYMGKTIVSGRRCYHVRGAAVYKHDETVEKKEVNFSGTFKEEYTYGEDFYLSDDGYPLMMSVNEEKRRFIRDNYTGEVMLNKKEYMRTRIIFMRME
jgi:hypothetical protein